MSTELDYLGVISQLWSWIGKRVGVTAKSRGGGVYVVQMTGGLAAEPAEPGDPVERVFFAVLAPGEHCGFTVDESAFTSALLTDSTDAAHGTRSGPVLIVRLGDLDLAISPLPPAPPDGGEQSDGGGLP